MKKSLWELYQDQLDDVWCFTDFDEFKGWWAKQMEIMK